MKVERKTKAEKNDRKLENFSNFNIVPFESSVLSLSWCILKSFDSRSQLQTFGYGTKINLFVAQYALYSMRWANTKCCRITQAMTKELIWPDPCICFSLCGWMIYLSKCDTIHSIFVMEMGRSNSKTNMSTSSWFHRPFCVVAVVVGRVDEMQTVMAVVRTYTNT